MDLAVRLFGIPGCLFSPAGRSKNPVLLGRGTVSVGVGRCGGMMATVCFLRDAGNAKAIFRNRNFRRFIWAMFCRMSCCGNADLLDKRNFEEHNYGALTTINHKCLIAQPLPPIQAPPTSSPTPPPTPPPHQPQLHPPSYSPQPPS